MMENKKNNIRKTVCVDNELVHACEALYSAAGVRSFSQFANMALQSFIDELLCKKQSTSLAPQLRKAIKEEVSPIASRLSKGLYRYAILLDILCQAVALNQFAGGDEIMEEFRRNANVRIAKMRGTINLQAIIDDTWEYLDREYRDWP